ncbi:MAG: hypothetical protein CMP06_08635 [Xanthomonadales bacterium]|nr:hypothetical protein [Xanthomonadales bacterium]
MVIIESAIFTRRIRELMSDDDYAALQASLVEHPDQGALIIGSGGLRKMRWATETGRGKSGGARIIYYWIAADGQIRMLYAYRKARQDDLTPDQLRLLRQTLDRW